MANASMVLVDLLGAVALLLWGMRMVKTGVIRAYGADLRAIIGRATANRVTAYGSGIIVTAILQSATATALMTTSFAARGLIVLPMALAVMLGADLGSTLVAQALSFRFDHLPAIFILIGVFTFLSASASRAKDVGRAVLGLGLMLLSLKLISAASMPLREAETLKLVLNAMGDDVLLVLIGALMTWLAHSSLAMVLLVVTLADGGVVDMHKAMVLVLGANLGGMIPPILAALSEGSAPAKRIAFGNAAFKIIMVLITIPFLGLIAPFIQELASDTGRQLVHFHTAFNLALGCTFILLIGPASRLVTRFIPEKVGETPGAALYLDRTTLDTPSLALTCAEREALRMGDTVGRMLNMSMDALTKDDRRLISELEAMDDQVDRLHEAIKLFVTDITRTILDESEGMRATEILAFSTNLEHIGDIIDKNLMELARKRLKHKLSFSPEGEAELRALHGQVAANLQRALGVFMSSEVKIARQLLDDKVRVRDAEWASAQSHLARLRQGRAESIESSALHLDVLSDLKRIHSHICAVAYPVLERAGELRPTRLIEGDKTSASAV
ncbi:Na/Pi cotransporter family protein [Lacibacterium aquatile]|uniref:Na/Pi cotransporter family protein n=1 Tax=Lacibacterium aquatile TaxID=1168082 RepID=A0ABW5DPS1_9PROT